MKRLVMFFQKYRRRVIMAVGLLALTGVIVLIVSLTSPKEDGMEYLIGVSQPNLTDNFQLQLYEDIDEQCKKYESVRFVSFDAGYSETKQKEDINTLLKLGLDALIVVTFEPEPLAETIQAAYDTGIPVIVIGYVPTGTDYTARIFTDNSSIGRQAAEYVRKLSNGRVCTVLEIQGEPHSRTSIELKNGFFEGIDPYVNITKEYVMTGYWSQEQTRTRMYESDFFSKDPPINVIFAHNDMMALGAAANLRETRKSAYIISVGGYSVKNSDLLAIKDGRINATFTYPTGGLQSVDVIVSVWAGEQVSKSIQLKSELINNNNVGDYLK